MTNGKICATISPYKRSCGLSRDKNKEEPSMENNCKKTLSDLIRSRIVLEKGDDMLMNMPFLFCAFMTLGAPWVALVGAVIALSKDYKFSIENNADKDEE